MSHRTFAILGWIVVGLFILGIFHLMMLRFSGGDVYPYYSSLRSDPLGTKAFYESLEVCCDFQIERNYEPFTRVKDRFDSTLFVLGMHYRSMEMVPKEVVEEVNYFISNGGRLVISLYRPQKQKDLVSFDPEKIEQSIDLTNAWGVRLFAEKKARGSANLTPEFLDSDLPRTISASTPLYFQTIHPTWKILYERAQHPVLIERKLGRGSIVLSTESFLFSNEAMVKERHSSLLSWFVGSPATVIFDEYHHGVATDGGVMYLARKYNLEWFFIVLILMALLFIWKNATPFVPPVQEELNTPQAGKESVAGLTNLLRRNVPLAKLLSVCFAEWQKSAKGLPEENQKRMEAIVASENAKPARNRDLPAAYNALSRALKERR